MTSQLSSGRSWCQNGQEDEESSAYYTGTATAASPGSHEYLDNCWPRLMCTPISDSYLTPLEGLTTGPCQAALGFQLLPVSHYSSLLKACLLSAPQSCTCTLEALLCSFQATAVNRMKGYCERQWKYFQGQEMTQSMTKKTAGKDGGMTRVLMEREVSCTALQSHPKLVRGNEIHDEKGKK